MRIRTKLELMAILPALVSIFVCAVLYMVYGNVDRLSRSSSQLQTAVQDVFDLGSASYEFLQNPTPVNGSMWHTRYQSLGMALARIQMTEREATLWNNLPTMDSERILSDRGLHQKIRAEYEALSTAFRSIEASSLKGQDVGSLPDAQTLRSTLHLMTSDILTLSSIIQSGSASIQTTGYMIIVFICVVLSLGVLAISIPFGVSLSNATRHLLDAIHAMSRGETDKSSTTPPNDELGDIARAFASMRTQVFESKQALAAQLEEHRQMAASLQATNFQLSDVLSRLERAKHQAIQQERLQAIHQLAYGVVHDLNSALTPIIGMAEFIQMDSSLPKDKPDVAEAIDLINDSAQNCRRVVMNLVELVHPMKPDATERVDLNEIIQSTMDITRPKWNSEAQLSNIHIEARVEPASAPLYVDSKRADLQECIASLIFNAIDAMPGGGVLTLACQDLDGQAVVTVTDTGMGMSEDARSRCFEPFFSTKAKDSTGMGLTTTRIVIARYRGTVELASEEGKGTTITIRLPKAVSEPLPVAPVPGTESARVLVVDDEAWALRILRKHLSMLGCDVVSAANSQEAIDLFKPKTFHAVMLDRAMPGMNGDELAARLKRMQPDLVIVMVTGFADLMQEKNETSPFVDIVLAKPFTQTELSNVVQRCRSMGWSSTVKPS